MELKAWMNNNMGKPTTKHLLQFIAILLFLVAWSILLYVVEPQSIVESIGIGNGYLVAFFVTLFAGLSALTSPAFFTTIGTLVFGGLNVYILGLIVGIAIFIGDTTFFFLGRSGRKAFLNESGDGKFHRLSRWIHNKPRWIVRVFMYLYLGFSPLPNDILMIALSVAGFKYRDIYWTLMAGNFTFGFVVTGVIGAFL